MSRFSQNQSQPQGPYGRNSYQNQNQGQGWRNNQYNQNNQGYGWRNNQNNGLSTRANEPPPEKKLDLEQALAQMLTSHSAFMNETKANMQQQATQLNNQAAQLRSLEAQMGQMANLLTERQQGSLPSNSEINPRGEGKEYCKAITLRSGKELEIPESQLAVREHEIKDQDQSFLQDQIQDEHPRETRAVKDNKVKGEIKKRTKTDELAIPIPYPQRLKKGKLEKQFAKFLDIFKKLHINIPFLEALENTPSYVKFMKKILASKKKLEEYGTIALTEECSAILQKKLPPKLQDPGSFAIPFSIGNQVSGKALCDLGASINLMPLSMFKRLKLGEPKSTTISLQLADRSYQHPRGIIENVLVKVGKFVFPADFVILDMEEDNSVPIILGRPFLATGKAQINVQEGELKLRVQGDEITFHVFQPMKHLDDDPNEDLSELHYTDMLQSNANDFQEKPIIAQKDTEEGKYMNRRVFHPP